MKVGCVSLICSPQTNNDFRLSLIILYKENCYFSLFFSQIRALLSGWGGDGVGVGWGGVAGLTLHLSNF